jgi:hypothetical protein
MVTEHLVALGDDCFGLFSSSRFREMRFVRVHFLTEIQFGEQFFSCLSSPFFRLWPADYKKTERDVGRR